MWVVKLGGSLHDTPALRGWLRWLATAPGPARIVVPGGGPFADTVRTLQPTLGFGELAAHRMAILAMQQYGLVLQALEPALSLAETDAELQAARAAVWLPWQLAGREARSSPAGTSPRTASPAGWRSACGNGPRPGQIRARTDRRARRRPSLPPVIWSTWPLPGLRVPIRAPFMWRTVTRRWASCWRRQPDACRVTG